MSDFKLIEEGEHHLHLQHPDGHSVNIAKSALSQKTLNKFRKMAEGGEVQPSAPGSDEEKKKVQDSFNGAMGIKKKDLSQPQNPKIAQSEVKNYSAGDIVKDPTEGLIPTDDNIPHDFTKDSTATEVPVTPQAAPQTDSLAGPGGPTLSNIWQTMTQPWGKSSVTPEEIKKYGSVDQATMAKRKEMGNSASQEAAAPSTPTQEQPQNIPLQQSQQNVQKTSLEVPPQNQQAAQPSQQQTHDNFINDIQNHYNDLHTEYENSRQDVMNGHIDPNRLFHNMNTGQKIGTAISLILGGLGGPNSGVHDFINKAIERDIDAQKAEIGKKNTLLEANLKQYGNMRDAIQATTLAYKAATDGMLGKAAATTAGGPLGKANYEAALLHSQSQSQMLGQQLAFRSALNKGGVQNAGYSYDQQFDYAAKMIGNSGLVDEKMQPEAFKELDRVRNAQQQSGDIMKAFYTSQSQNTIGNRAQHLGFSPQSVSNLENLMLPLIKDREGKVNEFEFNTIKKFIPAPGDGPEKTRQKEAGLKSFLAEKQKSSLLNGMQIPVPSQIIAKPLHTGPSFQQVGFRKP